jgi:lysozyme family protein
MKDTTQVLLRTARRSFVPTRKVHRSTKVKDLSRSSAYNIVEADHSYGDSALKIDGILGDKTCSKLQKWVNANQPEECSALKTDGNLGEQTITGLQLTLDNLGYEVKVDGTLGPKTVETLQRCANRYAIAIFNVHTRRCV